MSKTIYSIGNIHRDVTVKRSRFYIVVRENYDDGSYLGGKVVFGGSLDIVQRKAERYVRAGADKKLEV